MHVVVVGEPHLLPGVRGVHDDPHRYWPGQELVAGLRSMGHSATLLCVPPEPGLGRSDDALVGAFSDTLDLTDQLNDEIRRRRVDLVIAESWRSGLAAYRALRLHEIPFVVARTSGAAHPWDVAGLEPPPPGTGLEERLAALATLYLSRTREDTIAWLDAGVGNDRIWPAPPPVGRYFVPAALRREPVLLSRSADVLEPLLGRSTPTTFQLAVLVGTLSGRVSRDGLLRVIPAGSSRRRAELFRRAAGVVVDGSPLDLRLAVEADACACPVFVLAPQGALQRVRLVGGELVEHGAPRPAGAAIAQAARESELWDTDSPTATHALLERLCDLVGSS